MKKNAKRLICLILVFIMLFLPACDTSISDIMDDGANRFAAGKDEENYSLKNSGALLKSLLDDFSGSYTVPDATRMDDDDYDDAKKRAEEDAKDDDHDGVQEGTGDTPADDEPIRIGNRNELLDALYTAYSTTSQFLEFELVNGYTIDPNTELQKSYNDLQRRDPIYVCCVKQWSWGHRGSSYLIEIRYNMDIDELVALKDATDDLVDEAVSRINASGMSDYEIVCAVNEYLCDTVYYPDSEPYAPVTHTAYGALADGVAVCEGYACAAKVLLNELGVLCDIQFGVCTNGEGHAWNLVNLDGNWYQMDVTWNDGSASRSDYLLVTDDYMRKSRTWDENDYPACAGTAYTP